MELKKFGEFDRDVWITSDTHFSHKNIIEYCKRPYKSAWEMDTDLICNWNELVKPDDIVFHLGDFSFQSDKYRDKLNGKIHLIKGNHDKSKYDYLFDEVVDYAELQVGEYNCILTHIPILREYKDLKKNCAVLDVDVMKDYSFNLCGHCHEKWTVNGRSVNVGVDVWNYRPIHIGRLANFLRMLKKG